VCHAGKGDLAMPNMMADRRVARRYSLILPAEVIELSHGVKLNARTSDLSRTGCYLDTLQPLPSGSAIRIKLTQGSESIEVNGKVRYVSRGLGMGVQFEDQIPARQLAILESWLAMAAKQPA
jgi:hypothetical protein